MTDLTNLSELELLAEWHFTPESRSTVLNRQLAENTLKLIDLVRELYNEDSLEVKAERLGIEIEGDV